MQGFLKLVTIVSLAFIVSACGFHLRGKVELSKSLSNLYIESTDPALQAKVEDVLRFSGSTPVSDKSASSAVLQLSDINYDRIVRTVDSRGKITGYTLRYRSKFEVFDKAGESVLKSAPILLTRDFAYDSQQVLLKEDEELFLREDMEKDTAQQIVRQLGSIGR